MLILPIENSPRSFQDEVKIANEWQSAITLYKNKFSMHGHNYPPPLPASTSVPWPGNYESKHLISGQFENNNHA